MTAKQPLFMLIVVALALGAVGAGATGTTGPTKAQTCEAFKNTAAGAKALCLQIEHAKGALGKPHSFAKCESVFMEAFAKIEQRAGPGVCPTEGDAAAIEAVIDACASDVAAALSGSPPTPPPPCQQFPATGQTDSFRAGDDGDLEAGATLSYTDTGNGTIIDNNTGLEWEKKSDDGSINDRDATYTWENAFAMHIAGLNTAPCFAGHCDWRLPNVKELQSIVNYQFVNPTVSDAFKTPCVAGDTVLTGSCTAASSYWSSTTFASARASHGTRFSTTAS